MKKYITKKGNTYEVVGTIDNIQETARLEGSGTFGKLYRVRKDELSDKLYINKELVVEEVA